MRHLLHDWRSFALGSAFFAALTSIFGKIGVMELNSNLATLIRTTVILIVTTVIVTARHEWQAPSQLTPMGVVALILSGIATGLSWLCYFRALQLGPASQVAPIDRLSVVLVVVLAVLLLGERPSWQVMVGVSLITGGAILVSLPTNP